MSVDMDNTVAMKISSKYDNAAITIREKTQEELEKERIDQENGMNSFTHIVTNKYLSRRVISNEAKKMICDCILLPENIERGEMGCGKRCLNRVILIECGPKCAVGNRCANKRFQRHENADCEIFMTDRKGYGLKAASFIPARVFIMEFVGEVLDRKQFQERANEYSRQFNGHYYFMALSRDFIIDASFKGNISRFINHSCDPNAETQKWTVNGQPRIGFFSTRDILPDEEITIDYQFQRFDNIVERCFCEAAKCRGWISAVPNSGHEIDVSQREMIENNVTVRVLSPRKVNEGNEAAVRVLSPRKVNEGNEVAVRVLSPKKLNDGNEVAVRVLIPRKVNEGRRNPPRRGKTNARQSILKYFLEHTNSSNSDADGGFAKSLSELEIKK